MGFVNTEQAEYWASRARSWTAHEAFHDRVIGPAGVLAMDQLDPRPGQVVVDLGCGTGMTTVELARRVGPGGRVVGLDIATAMFDRARRHIADAGVANVELVHADVQSSDLGQDRFDGAFSRFGVMFFSDPVAAFTNVRRSLKPGAALSFACWQSFLANDWMSVPGQAAVAVLGGVKGMPAAEGPGPFSLSEPARVRGILDEAGFRKVEIASHEEPLVVPRSGLADMAESALYVGPVQRMLQDAQVETVALVRRAILDALESRVVDGEAALGRAYLLVTAKA